MSFGLEDVRSLLGHSTIVLTSDTHGHVLEQPQRQLARAVGRGTGRMRPLSLRQSREPCAGRSRDSRDS